MQTEPDDGGVRLMAQHGKRDHVNVGATERIASAVAGGFLSLFGLRRRGKAGYGMALLGAELLYRGASGHCKTYSMLGVSTVAQPAARKFGDRVARMFGRAPNRQVRQALERFKEMAEGRTVVEVTL